MSAVRGACAPRTLPWVRAHAARAQKNFNEEHGVVSFTRAELEGVPADVMSGYTKRTEGAHEVFDVPFRTTDIFPVVRGPPPSRLFFL